MKNNTRIRWIDALRGYGAISVAIVHLIQAMQERKLLGGNFCNYLFVKWSQSCSDVLCDNRFNNFYDFRFR